MIPRTIGDLCREVAASGETLRFRVVGDCMDPLICDGDEVEAEPGRWLLPGDVVAVVGVDDLVRVHRFLGVVPHPGPGMWTRARWITRADAARWVDPPAGRSRILGKVRGASMWRRGVSSLHLVRVVLAALGRRMVGSYREPR